MEFLSKLMKHLANMINHAHWQRIINLITFQTRTQSDKAHDIQRDVRSCHVTITIFTQRFHELLDKDDKAGVDLRDGLNEFLTPKYISKKFLLVFFEECSVSSRWFKASSVDLYSSTNPDTRGLSSERFDQSKLEEVLEKIKVIRNDKI